MIDALERQLAPIDKELRAYARRQAGCKALMVHYGIGPLVAVTILAELGDCTRFSSSRHAVRYAGMDITVYQSDQHRAPGHLSPPRTAGAALGAVRGRPVSLPAGQPGSRLLRPGGGAARSQPRVPVGRAQAPEAQLPHAARARRGGTPARMTFPVRAKPFVTPDAPRPAPGMLLPPRSAWTALKDRAAATLPPAGSPHQTSCRRPRSQPEGRGPK